jgi:hypothetical protein
MLIVGDAGGAWTLAIPQQVASCRAALRASTACVGLTAPTEYLTIE